MGELNNRKVFSPGINLVECRRKTIGNKLSDVFWGSSLLVLTLGEHKSLRKKSQSQWHAHALQAMHP